MFFMLPLMNTWFKVNTKCWQEGCTLGVLVIAKLKAAVRSPYHAVLHSQRLSFAGADPEMDRFIKVLAWFNILAILRSRVSSRL